MTNSEGTFTLEHLTLVSTSSIGRLFLAHLLKGILRYYSSEFLYGDLFAGSSGAFVGSFFGLGIISGFTSISITGGYYAG